MEVYQIVVLCAAAVASSFIKNTAALGAGVFLTPVLAAVFPPKIALGLGAPILIATDVSSMKNYWGEWENPKEVLRIGISAIPGVILGACIINVVPNNILKTGIGTFALLFSVYHLVKESRLYRSIQPSPTTATGDAPLCSGTVSCTLVGVFGGLASILAHAGGLVFSLYYVGKKLEKRCLMASLIAVFCFSDVVKLIAYLNIGVLSADSCLIILAMSPIIILGGNLGNFLNRKMRTEVFRKIVLLLVFVSAINLLL
ncbi:sulfite exporter TauE/SafE family protein [Desulfomonile tiedjei]|uniref:Probable membrane transporter protein n=1 Tax=Desulfomonile tiedjei (strain ATCC 49306 / DSM 6799 / DCB-1) TaxID=706587 RepID=I4C4W3_DESTA|nr:sulfite exporter TauE/SafE family protein [Desulfomonile tiedjei]AFM24604.1 putative permease [Desulfomonile tiedjei DSM 6799]